MTSRKHEKGKARAYVGRVIAEKYRVLDALGEGGFGTVLLVENTTGMVDKKLALKLLPEELSSSPAFREQFKHEASVAMRLVDKHIVQIRDVGITEEGLPYYTMDYCPGETLALILKKEEKLPISRAVSIVLNVLRGLQTAHAEGIIHRDLKPSNLMVDSNSGKDTVKILDLGIATAVETQGKRGGTPAYMAPEQFSGDRIGFSTDLYSLGVILYECLTGQKPHAGSTKMAVLDSLSSRAPPRPEELTPEVKEFPGLSSLVMKAVERNPEKRFQSARELFDALRAVLSSGTASPNVSARSGAPSPGRRTVKLKPRGPTAARPQARGGSSVGRTLAIGGLAVLILGVGAFFLMGKKSQKTEAKPEVVNPVPTAAPKAVTQEAKPSVALLEPPKPDETNEVQVTASEAEDWFRKGQKELEGGDFQRAWDSLGKADGLWPVEKPKKDLSLLRARVASKLKQPEKAEGFLEDVLQQDGKDPEANDLKAQILEEKGSKEKTKAFVKAAKDEGVSTATIEKLHQKYFVDEPKVLRDEAIELLTRARDASSKRDVPGTAKAAAEAFEKWRSADACLIAADSYLNLGEVAKGLEITEKALSPPRLEGSREAIEALQARYAYFKGKKLLFDIEAQDLEKASVKQLSEAEASLKDAATRASSLSTNLRGDLLPFARLGLAQGLAFGERPDLAIDGPNGARTLEKEPGDKGVYLVAEECRTLLLSAARSSDQEARRIAYRIAKGRINALLKLAQLPKELRSEGYFLSANSFQDLKSAEAADALKKAVESGFKIGKGYTYRPIALAPFKLPDKGYAPRLKGFAQQETDAGGIRAQVSFTPDGLVYSMAHAMESLDAQRLTEDKVRQALTREYRSNKSQRGKPLVFVSLSLNILAASESNTYYLFRESLDNHVVLRGAGLQKGPIRNVSPVLPFRPPWRVRVTSGGIDDIGLSLFPSKGVSFEFPSLKELKATPKDPVTVTFTKIICQTRGNDPKKSINPRTREITFNDWSDVYVKNAAVSFNPEQLKLPPAPDRFDLILWTLENQ